MNIPRYKLAIQVVLGSVAGQAVKVVSKCLWDPNFDNFSSVSYSNVTPIYSGIPLLRRNRIWLLPRMTFIKDFIFLGDVTRVNK